MPTRILRDWTRCQKVNALSANAERLFTRLWMKADDHGLFYADYKELKLNLFPYNDGIKEAEITKCLEECRKELIIIYEQDGKRYLQIKDFKQRPDKAKPKFPLPDENQLIIEPYTTVNDRIRKQEEIKEDSSKLSSPEDQQAFKMFQEFISKHAPTVGKMKQPFTIKEFLAIKKEFTPQFVRDMVLRMHNWKPLLTKNTSANLTFRDWSKKNLAQEPPNQTKPNLAAAVKKIEDGAQ